MGLADQCVSLSAFCDGDPPHAAEERVSPGEKRYLNQQHLFVAVRCCEILANKKPIKFIKTPDKQASTCRKYNFSSACSG